MIPNVEAIVKNHRRRSRRDIHTSLQLRDRGGSGETRSTWKPLLLWGPRDEAPLPRALHALAVRPFATSKALQKLGVPFTYINNCRVEDLEFDRGITDSGRRR